MPWFILLVGFSLPVPSAQAGGGYFSAFDYYQTLVPTRPRPSEWPSRLPLVPQRYDSLTELKAKVQRQWRVLFHCNGAPASQSSVTKAYRFEEGGQRTLTYVFEDHRYQRLVEVNEKVKRNDHGELEWYPGQDGTFDLRMENVDNPQLLSYRPLLIEETGELAFEGVPDRRRAHFCEDGTELRALWVPMDTPVS